MVSLNEVWDSSERENVLVLSQLDLMYDHH